MVSPRVLLIIQLLLLYVAAKRITCIHRLDESDEPSTHECAADENLCSYSKQVENGKEWQSCKFLENKEDMKYIGYCVKRAGTKQYEYLCNDHDSCNTKTHCTSWVDEDKFDEYIENGGSGGGGGAGGPPGGGGAGGPPGGSKPKNGGESINPGKFVISALFINAYLLLC